MLCLVTLSRGMTLSSGILVVLALDLKGLKSGYSPTFRDGLPSSCIHVISDVPFNRGLLPITNY